MIDFYNVLGVLPNTEHVVIVAAYRALANKYHPDRWQGDKTYAHNKMAEINLAYATLSESDRRKVYDETLDTRAPFPDVDDDCDSAFDAALTEVEGRWLVAVKIFPDLTALRSRLSKVAHRLSFEFVTILIETKRFKDRHLIADVMETSFLERYFGVDPTIVRFARELIQYGHRDAIKALNQYVEVLGTEAPALMIIGQIKSEFAINSAQSAVKNEFKEALKLDDKKHTFFVGMRLARESGYRPVTSWDGIRVEKDSQIVATFKTENEFIEWVVQNCF